MAWLTRRARKYPMMTPVKLGEFFISFTRLACVLSERPGYLYCPSGLNPPWYIQAQFLWESCETSNVYCYFILKYYHWNCVVRITEWTYFNSCEYMFSWPVYHFLLPRNSRIFPCSSDTKFDTSCFPAEGSWPHVWAIHLHSLGRSLNTKIFSLQRPSSLVRLPVSLTYLAGFN